MRRSWVLFLIIFLSVPTIPIIPNSKGDPDTPGGTSGRDIMDAFLDDFNDFGNTSVWDPELVIDDGNVTVGMSNCMNMSVDDATIVMLHFDEGTGMRTRDSSPLGLNATMNNMDGSAWTNGICGKGLDFDGIDDYVQLPENSAYDSSNITVESWVFQHSFIDSAQDETLLTKRGGYFLTDFRFVIDTPTVVSAGIYKRDLRVWKYAVGTFDGSVVRYYQNGNLKADTPSSSPIDNELSSMRIGASGFYVDDDPFYPFDGVIDEVRVSKVARTAAEINKTYLDITNASNARYYPSGHLVSNEFNISIGVWDFLTVDKNCPPGTSINVTVLDSVTGTPIRGFMNLSASAINISTIDPTAHPSLKLRADFVATATAAPRLDRWGVTWDRIEIPPPPPDLPDLTISTNDIVFSDENPSENDTFGITVTVHNIGKETANDVDVYYTDNATLNEDLELISTIASNGGEGQVRFQLRAYPSGNHTFTFMVDRNNRIGESNEFNNNASRSINVIAPTPPPPPGAPSPPLNLKSKQKDMGVDLEWDPPMDIGSSRLSGYEVKRSNGSAPWETLVTLLPSNRTCRDTDIAFGNTYTYVVVAWNAAGASNRSNTVTESIVDAEIPSIAIILPSNNSRLEATKVMVTGTASDNNGINKVEVRTGSTDWVMANGTTSWSCDLELVEGENSIYARVTDIAGNTNQTSVTVRVYISEVPPPSYFEPFCICVPSVMVIIIAAFCVILYWIRRPR